MSVITTISNMNPAVSYSKKAKVKVAKLIKNNAIVLSFVNIQKSPFPQKYAIITVVVAKEYPAILPIKNKSKLIK